MDPVNYYITTLSTAFKNIAPVVAFIIGGYFIFIKMPFLFFKKSMDDQKKKMDQSHDGKEEKYTLEQYKEFQKTMKLLNNVNKPDRPKNQSGNERPKEEKRKPEVEKEEIKKEFKDKEAPKKAPMEATQTPEEIFNIKPGEKFSQQDLKKRYFELLKQNHPDRVASMGNDFKKLAEKNTKEINKAYDRLKKKAS